MKIFIVLILSLLLVSCNSTKNLKGRVYELSDAEQNIRLDFFSNNECRIQQSYKCEKLPDSFAYLSLEAKYRSANRKLKYSKNKSINVDYIIFKNSDSIVKNLPNYTYIPNYEELCLSKVTENSREYKVRQRLKLGVILNLINDSIQIKRDTIIFGYKKVPRIR